MTSLYQAFFGVGGHRYYLKLRNLLAGKDFEEAIFHLRHDHKRAKRLATIEAQSEDLTLPLSVLMGHAGGFMAWMFAVSKSVEDSEERLRLQQSLTELYEETLGPIDVYEFPVVTLSDATSADAVCTIFETLNRTGVKLTPFELLTARFWPLNVNLRELWRDAKIEYPIVADFHVDPYYALQVVALISRTVPSCKRSDVLELKASQVNEHWDSAIRGMSTALEVLRDDCGVLIPTWLPYNTILIPMAAVFAVADHAAHEEGMVRQRIARWFWCACLGQAYESAPNSQAVVDFQQIKTWLAAGEPPIVVSEFAFDPNILQRTTVRQRALYRATMCLLLRHRPRDFFKFAEITGDLIVENNVDDHHIFPQAYLKRALGVSPRDSVLNHTLIDRKTNIRISDRAPSVYMKLIKDSYEGDAALGAGKFDALLDSHLLPSGSDSPLWADDFQAFAAWRQVALWDQIKAVTGVVDVADEYDADVEDDQDDQPMDDAELEYWQGAGIR